MSKQVGNIGKRGAIDTTLVAMFSNPQFNMDYQFYAHLVSQCSIEMNKSLPAAAGVYFHHDHYVLSINPDLFDDFPLLVRLGIIKHEMLHILNDHVKRLKELIPDFEEKPKKEQSGVFKKFNFASDCAINQFIKLEHLPQYVITPESLSSIIGVDVPKNKTSEYYYELIKSQQPNFDKNTQNQGDPSNGEGDGNGDGNGKGSGEAKGDPSNGEGSGYNTVDDHDIWKKSVGDTTLQKDLTKKMIEKAQYETIKSRGNVPSQLSDWLELHSINTEINWKQHLRRIVGNRKVNKRPTIKKRDRRQPWRRELRGKTKDRIFDLLVIADVSGSMPDKAVVHTFAEVRNICDMTKTPCNLIQIDARAYPPEELKKSTKVIERKGHGGTDLFPAIEMAKKHNIKFDAIVVLTDGGLYSGEIDLFASLKVPIIWLIEPNGTIMDGMNSGRMKAIKLNKMVLK